MIRNPADGRTDAKETESPPWEPDETFLQRQQRVYGTPEPEAPKAEAPSQGTPASPVSANGRITPDAAPQQTATQAPQAASGATTQPQGYTYTAQPVAAPSGGWAVYQPSVQAPRAQAYDIGPQSTYTAQQVQQFQAPTNPAIDQSLQQHYQQMLANPYSMSQQVVDQQKQAATEQALSMQKQMLAQLGSQMAGRNIDVSQGYGAMLQRQAMQDTMSKILGEHRALDVTKAQTDRQDLLNALSSAEGGQSSALQRAIGGYQTGLQGLESRRAENLAQIGSEQDLSKLRMQAQQQSFADALAAAQFNEEQQYRKYQSELAAQTGDISRLFQNQGLLQNQAQLGQFGQSMAFDREKYEYQKQQDLLAQQAAAAAQSASYDRWADEQAMRYQQMQNDEYNSLLQYLMGGE